MKRTSIVGFLACALASLAPISVLGLRSLPKAHAQTPASAPAHAPASASASAPAPAPREHARGEKRADEPGYPRHRSYERPAHDLKHWLRGDWEPPDALFLAFTADWSDSLATIIAGAVDQAQITVLVDTRTTTEGRIDEWLEDFHLPVDEIRMEWMPLDSAWVRDYGPLERMPAAGYRGAPMLLDTEYIQNRPADDAVPAALAPSLGMDMAALPVPLHGGAIISNGRGLCALTIEYCQDKGLDIDDPAFMDSLSAELGCQTIALLPDLKDDSTRHADMFAQFLAPDVVAVARVDGAENAEDAARMDEAARGLAEAAARMGSRLRVVRVPIPYLGAGTYFTYLNGLRLRDSFMVPSYRDAPREVEQAAYRALSDALPGVSLVTVPADAIIPHAGSLHCISLGLSSPKKPLAAGQRRAGGPLLAADAHRGERHVVEPERH